MIVSYQVKLEKQVINCATSSKLFSEPNQCLLQNLLRYDCHPIFEELREEAIKQGFTPQTVSETKNIYIYIYISTQIGC